MVCRACSPRHVDDDAIVDHDFQATRGVIEPIGSTSDCGSARTPLGIKKLEMVSRQGIEPTAHTLRKSRRPDSQSGLRLVR